MKLGPGLALGALVLGFSGAPSHRFVRFSNESARYKMKITLSCQRLIVFFIKGIFLKMSDKLFTRDIMGTSLNEIILLGWC